MAILTFLLPLFFLVFGFGEVLRAKYIVVASTGLIDILALAIAIVWLIFVKKSEYELKKPLLIFMIIASFSLVINVFNYTTNQLFIGFLYLFRFGIYALLYFAFVDIGRHFKKLIPKFMFLSGAIFMVLGLAQYIFYPSLKSQYFLGWDMHEYRLFSTFFDPNFAGTFLVLLLIFTYILRDKIFPDKWKLLVPLILVINFISILLTYSRGAYLMLLVSIIIYSFLTKAWKLTIGLIVSFIVFFFIVSPKFDLESTNLLRVASIENRIGSSKDAIEIYKQNKLGVGFNTYRYAREKYSNYPIRGIKVSHAGAGVDNSLIFVLVTTSVVGLIAYIYLLFKILKLGYINSEKNKYALVLVVSLAGLAVNALTINSLFYSFVLLWIFMLAGFTESSLRK